jgi:hypothetical protein
MSVEIHQANGGYMFYCTTADRAFGPTMESFEQAEAFSIYLHADPRSVGLAELAIKWKEFQDQSESPKGDVETLTALWTGGGVR